MQKSVLVEIVRSLSRKEIREVQKWLQSPAHNQRQDVVRLFDYMVKNSGQEKEIEKEQAWSVIFSEQPFDDAYMRQVMYFLLKALEDYLAFIEHVSDKVRNQITLARIYRQRKLEKAYKQAYRLALDYLESQPLRNGDYLLNKFFLEQEEYEYKGSITQNASVNLQEMGDALEKWFIAERLKISKDMLVHHRRYQTITYKHGLLNEVLNCTERSQLSEVPAIAANYCNYMVSNNREEIYFDQLENIIHNQMEHFHQSEIRTLYLAALNYCTAKVNQGQVDYCRRALKFYKTGMEKEILLENNVITRYTFGNAVAFAVKIGEFDWAEQFIERFQGFLEEKQRHSIVNFNLSRVYFEKGDYNRAQQLLTQFEYDDMLLNIIAKTMLLKIYYEQDELDAFESLLESMRIYLQRKEALDPTRKASYKNMISLMKKLMRLNPYSKAQKEKLRELVTATNPLMERDWLLRQLGDK